MYFMAEYNMVVAGEILYIFLLFLFLNFFRFLWYWCYYPHTLSNSVSPICRSFFYPFFYSYLFLESSFFSTPSLGSWLKVKSQCKVVDLAEGGSAIHWAMFFILFFKNNFFFNKKNSCLSQLFGTTSYKTHTNL